ncbi:phosphatase PAP2 family protein [Winogradskyella schleiferi]|uniref:phosphatase PAP2 family protein n=1 Tax=Winogradskyella schleiferi TaxID=2686078 RepID=UPI0015BFD1F7|nr:phosphatase PAP2 family protein [Winogradskyella schleiferi]
MKIIIASLFITLLNLPSLAQQKSTSPYEWKWKRDGIWTAAGLGASYYGLSLIRNKDDLTPAELQSVMEKQDDINFIDRWVAGNNSDNARSISDIPFALSFAAPFALLFDDEVNDHTAQVLGIYLESMATTGALYTITAGLANRSRPYVYNTENSDFRRLSKNGQRSFYSGHVAATATATFFSAKAFQDFNPDSAGIPYVWAGAAILPAAVGYLRLQAGEHFLTDVLLGYGLGALAGYYIPELHKRKDEMNLGLTPVMGRTRFGDTYQALSLNYTF